MKILTGRLRGQRIEFHPDPELRPTADKARKAVFDIFQGEMEGKRVLDLFSGTGALGLEALSQGAAYVLFVEKDKTLCRRILKNLERMRLSDQADVRCEDALEVLRRLGGSGEAFDFVFVDPPYDDGMGARSLENIDRADLMAEGGFVLVECRIREDLPPEVGKLKILRDKRYGQTKILIYKSSG